MKKRERKYLSMRGIKKIKTSQSLFDKKVNKANELLKDLGTSQTPKK